MGRTGVVGQGRQWQESVEPSHWQWHLRVLPVSSEPPRLFSSFLNHLYSLSRRGFVVALSSRLILAIVDSPPGSWFAEVGTR
jgi:hypothetical protein